MSLHAGREEGRPARDHDTPAGSRAGRTCWICGQPIPPHLWDMTVFADPVHIAYLPCLFARTSFPPAA